MGLILTFFVLGLMFFMLFSKSGRKGLAGIFGLVIGTIVIIIVGAIIAMLILAALGG